MDGEEPRYSHPLVNAALSDANESQLDTPDITPTPSDVVISLLNQEYKTALDLEIEALTRMKNNGETLDTKERAGVLLKCFREKVVKNNGRFLQLHRIKKIHEEITEDVARNKIRVDLSRGVSKQTNKRKPAEDLDDNWGTRPKRGIQQLKSRKNNMPYNEIINITANPIGHDVMMYEENSDFNPKLVTSHQDKLECAGQIFATRLIERSAWNVKGCHLKDNTSAFVTFKDCNRCNGNEYKADEGKNKFTGYQKLAEYVLCNGMAEELIKESKETEEMFDSLGLVYGDSEEVAAEAGKAVATPTSSNTPTTHQTGPVVTETNVQLTRGTNISPCETISFLASSPTVKHNDDTRHTETEQDANLIYSAVTPTAHNTCPYEHADKSAQPTTIDIIQKRKEVKEVRKRVSEKLDHARTTYITSEDMWKRDQAINFYNTLRRWLLQLAGDIMSIRNFDPEEVNCAIAEFEGSMADLLESEDNHDEDDTQFHMKMVASWVVEVKRKFLVGS